MSVTKVKCSHCGGDFPLDSAEGWTERPCPVCQEKLRVYAFPAILGSLALRPRAATAAMEGEATCFFHAHKRAAIPCDGCGRFLCDLCDLQFRGRHFCASCLNAAQHGSAASDDSGNEPALAEAGELLKEKIFLHHNFAWLLAFYSPLTLIGVYLMPVTAPAALWFSLRHWKRRDGFQIRGRWRAWASVCIALIQLALMAFGALVLAFGLHKVLNR